MEMENHLTPPNTLHDKRALNKLGLETFALDYVNRFDYAASNAIEELKRQLTVCFQKDAAYKAHRKNKHQKRPEQLQDVEDPMEVSYPENADELDNLTDMLYIGEEILAFEEMKVTYAYKQFEIHVKRLMSATYPTVPTKELYKWDILMSFLRSKGIAPKQLDRFTEVDELRRVNNTIKHSSEIDLEAGRITEFIGKSTFTYVDLAAFYERVKHAPSIFLESLAHAIYKDLYHFDDARIERLVVDFVQRMEPDTAAALCEKLQAHYL